MQQGHSFSPLLLQIVKYYRAWKCEPPTTRIILHTAEATPDISKSKQSLETAKMEIFPRITSTSLYHGERCKDIRRY